MFGCLQRGKVSCQLTFNCNKPICAQTLDDRDAGQDHLRHAAFFDNPARQVAFQSSRIGLSLKPSPEAPRIPARGYLEALNLANGVQMLLTGLAPRGTGQDIIAGQGTGA